MTRDEVMALPEDQFKQLFGFCMSRASSVNGSIADIPVGHSKTFTHWRNISALGSKRREVARRQLNAPEAQWCGQTTTKGIRVTRIR